MRIAVHKKSLTNTILLNYLYNVFGKGNGYNNDYYDIIIGQAGQNIAKIGYDNVTGLGTPKNNSSINGLISGLVNIIP